MPADVAQLRSELRIAQREAWERGERVFVETYLQKHPELSEESVLDLIYSEYCLREEFGNRPDPAEYARRFPQRSESLQRLFDLHRAKAGSSATATFTTKDHPSPVVAPVSPKQPEHIGRYRVEKLLGRGGFGLVYLSYDDQLERQVAIKVPHSHLVAQADHAKAYLTEARTVAHLEHPNIVPVHDVGSTDQFPCYVVSKYIDGCDLATKLRQSRLTIHDAAGLISTVAEALHHTHKQGLVHRDIKPANILLDKHAKPYVADFGLALRERDIGKGSRYVGTPAYMSPEQARGEGHRVDGRSDIFSLGVVLYEMLTGRRPFEADTPLDLLDQIANYEPRPPRQLDEQIPRELDRICLKALAKRASERYSTAIDMADDLRCFLAESSSPIPLTTTSFTLSDTAIGTPVTTPANTSNADTKPIKIVPKGLRSFDANDADFFLELLPGPRDRDGLPDSIRFWKTRIEETDADNTFSVGLIYGPSGCGKSSLVKAGLMPHLSDSIIPVYVEATAEETETRLLNGLRKRCPLLPNNLTLKNSLAALRLGQGIPEGKKIVIILDQFEQWLHAEKDEQNTELVQALRHCDGCHVQCVVMVRDDFWLAVSRFLKDLEIRIIEGYNSALVDLFPIRHAEKALTAFGQAFGTLPEKATDINIDQQAFIQQAVSGLAEEGKVICVRLALFAEMMKGRSWTPGTLKEVGGTGGVGVTFLEETFSASTAPPEHRYHQKAARAILKALLPDSGTDIKGHMRSYGELIEASGYSSRREDFDVLIRILDSELRLITPTSPEGVEENSPANSRLGERYYQITHDYLVPSLHDWLTRKQRETRRGRAELKLAERVSAWNVKRETKQLPTLFEWLGIRLLTDHHRWTEPQHLMMQKAKKLHLTHWGSALAFLLLASIAALQLFSAQRWASLKAQTIIAVDAAQNNVVTSVKYTLLDLRKLPRELVEPELRARFEAETDPRRKLGLAFALAGYDQVKADYLVGQIDTISQEETSNFITALDSHREKSITAISNAASACDKPLWRRKAKLATVALYLGSSEIAEDMCAVENRPDPEQRTLFVDEFPQWNGDLQRVLEIAVDVESTALRSAICLVLGQLPASRVSNDKKHAFEAIVTKWYREKPDTTTHSASGWLLQKWGISPPAISEASKIVADRHWFINSAGMTMLKILPSSFRQAAVFNDEKRARDIEINESYLLADREVTVGQFQPFIDDNGYVGDERPSSYRGVDSSISPTPNHPAQMVSWYEAILYCNWLSLREGRQPCYERTGEKEKGSDGKPTGYDAWRPIPRATGYRLPTAAEWELACRAGTTTALSFGNDDSLLGAYARTSSRTPLTCGDKLPNGWGMFDMHGNVSEWCEDAIKTLRLSRGGSWGSSVTNCQSGFPNTYMPGSRTPSIGFRVAMSLPDPLPKLEAERKKEMN